ncbi:hypothetical protein GCM10017687_05440 [Streptomyces echinatus]
MHALVRFAPLGRRPYQWTSFGTVETDPEHAARPALTRDWGVSLEEGAMRTDADRASAVVLWHSHDTRCRPPRANRPYALCA